ncbi:unnamed protein product [Mytilus edulis]|uniref:Chitin-binding type-4 domain-containing protein n=1 Tax=Mytilus edulis TaxID=6550 RepID=A0A8S3S328_MYTED|nr:unnamed protein product [Mytilus edulis]
MKEIIFIWIFCVGNVIGHGKLWEPPARSTMWRRGFKTIVNPNDNELNCGGIQNHWIKYGGRCGVCGDPYQTSPRPNEAGGKYAAGVITRQYKSGQIIDLAVDITANHVGYFEFRLCPNNDVTQPITQKCLNRYPIFVVGSKDGRYHVGGHQNGIVVFKGKLPKGLVCSQCVMQWRYRTGNRWGCNKKTGKCGKGYGPQEEFYGCSDVTITTNTVGKSLTMRKPVNIRHNEAFKSNFKLLSNPSDLISTIGKKTGASPVFDKLTSILWTLLQTIISTNRGSRVALVQWNPIGHDIVELGKANQLSVLDTNQKHTYKRPSNHWPSSKPTVIEADIGEEEDGPMMLSEIVVDEDWRTPTVIKKYTDGPKGFVASESKCRATKEFEHVEGTNRWCGVNCDAGNCPKVMCTCETKAINSIATHKYKHSRPSKIHTIKTSAPNQGSIKTVKHNLVPNSKNRLFRLLSHKKNVVPNKIQSSNSKRTLSKPIRTMHCQGAGKFASHRKMVGWCLENCSKGFCPKSICECSKII